MEWPIKPIDLSKLRNSNVMDFSMEDHYLYDLIAKNAKIVYIYEQSLLWKATIFVCEVYI